jgi:ribosomal protein S18 acetylase RimI-like enzyme
MIEKVVFSRNKSSYQQVLAHLRVCDSDFMPPLSQRLSVSAYALKLMDKAARFEAWCDTDLVGLVALYCNDSSKSSAFITNVSVIPQWQGRGIAGLLIGHCADAMSQLLFKAIELEVDERNSAAIGLYKKYGFVPRQASDQSLLMTLAIGG